MAALGSVLPLGGNALPAIYLSLGFSLQNKVMAHAVTRARAYLADPTEALRFAIVNACGLALIAAGSTLPF